MIDVDEVEADETVADAHLAAAEGGRRAPPPSAAPRDLPPRGRGSLWACRCCPLSTAPGSGRRRPLEVKSSRGFALPRRLPRPGNPPSSPLADATGGTLPARVPGGTQPGLVPGAVQEPGAGGGGDPAADPALRVRRRHPVLGSADPARGDGAAGGLHRRGPHHSQPGAHRRRPGPPAGCSTRPESHAFVLETISRVRGQLGETPLIGFAGAPFTVATYAIEGKTSKRFIETKKLFYRDPAAARRLLALIGEATERYLLAQVAAGAQAIQIFDSWLGVVSVEDWDEFVAAPTAKLVEAVRASGVPVIYFPNGATTLLERIATVGADVYGIDWRLPIDEARARLFHGGATGRGRPGQPRSRAAAGPARPDRAGGRRHRRPGRPARPRLQPGPRHLPRDADRERRDAGARGPRAPEPGRFRTRRPGWLRRSTPPCRRSPNMSSSEPPAGR